MANRIFIINIKRCEFVAEVKSMYAANKLAKKATGDFIVTQQDDLKQLKDEVKIKLISAWRGDEIESVKPVALEYRVMNLLEAWVGNVKVTLKEEKKMTKKKVVKKKAPVRKVAAKKAPVKKPVTKKKVATKKAPVKKPAGTRSAVDNDAFTKEVKRLMKAQTPISEAYAALRDKFGISAISPIMKRCGLSYDV